MKPIGITIGDPAGVGPEVLLMALADAAVRNQIPIQVYGDRGILENIACSLGRSIDFPLIQVGQLAVDFVRGRYSPEGGMAQLQYLKAAADDLARHELSALVTGPIHKRAFFHSGEIGPGQTEWLGRRLGARRPVMMLAGPRLKVILATTHVALRQVAGLLAAPDLIETVLVAHEDLKRFFHPAGAKLALAALNPHGEEDGEPGREEKELLGPAVASLRSHGVNIEGPVPADTVFAQACQGRYDAVVALYHDQGLAPIKTVHFFEAVNLTLGLGRIRTSPDHGVAYDLAGSGRADCSSFKAALELAWKMGLVESRERQPRSDCS